MSKDLKSTEGKEIHSHLLEEKKTVAVASRERPKREGKRKPMSDPGRLKFEKIPGHRLYLVASDDDHAHRFQAFKDNWWEPVQRKEVFGSDCENPDSYVEISDSAKLKLMKLPEELALEDDKAAFEVAARQLEKVRGAAKEMHGAVSMDWESAKK